MSSPHGNPYASPSSMPSFPTQKPGSQEKPAAILVFGILHLIFGVLGLCGLGTSIVQVMTVANVPGAQMDNPILDDRIGYLWTLFSIAIGTVTTFLLLAAGVLLLTDKELGRVLTIIYGWISIGFGVVGLVVLAIVFLGMASNADAIGEEQEKVVLLVAAVFGTCMSIIGMIYPGLAIYFMSRENVKQYLKRVA